LNPTESNFDRMLDLRGSLSGKVENREAATMPISKRRTILACMLLWLAGCSSQSDVSSQTDRHRITQFSIINALMLGHYDGFASVEELRRYGNFGLGACDCLDGELILLDGKAYQAKADGTIVVLGRQAKIPFAMVASFDKSNGLPCPKLNSLEELESRLDGQLENKELFSAIRVEATFASIQFRSVPGQQRPYRPLAEVAKQQRVHTQNNVGGTLIGFRTPKWAESLTVPGYHWHFLSDDHQRGGHVLNCELASGSVAYQQYNSWLVKLPDTLGAAGKDMSVDLRRDVEQVERSRHGSQ
jgi:acetolactate decarboxylase